MSLTVAPLPGAARQGLPHGGHAEVPRGRAPAGPGRPGGREGGRGAAASFQKFDLGNGPGPWEFELSKGHVEVNITNGSGIRDPQFKIEQIGIMIIDCSGQEGPWEERLSDDKQSATMLAVVG